MRPLELILVLASAAVSLRLAATGRIAGVAWIYGIPLALAVPVVAQVMLEGWRWQVLPAYAAAFLTASTPLVWGLGAVALFWSATASLGLLAVAAMSCLAFPFVAPPAPQGPYAIGLTSIPVGVQRPPELTPWEMQATPRVQLWYPAAPQPETSLSAWFAQRVAVNFRSVLPAWGAHEAPVAKGKKFPVVMYFDGWPEDKTQNVALLRELASRGFAIASVTYPRADRPMVDYSSEDGFKHSIQLDHLRARLHARDAVTILDTLARLDAEPGSPFAQQLDTQHSTVIGFSFGGAIAAEASWLDSRILAAVNLDGRHWGDALDHGVAKPYLFICEELLMPTAASLASSDPATRYEARLDRVDYSQLDANMRARGGVRVTIKGAAHLNFTDLPLRSPLRHFSGGGTIDAGRARDIIRTYVVEFLSRYGIPGQPRLNAPWPHFPEAHLETWPAPGQ